MSERSDGCLSEEHISGDDVLQAEVVLRRIEQEYLDWHVMR